MCEKLRISFLSNKKDAIFEEYENGYPQTARIQQIFVSYQQFLQPDRRPQMWPRQARQEKEGHHPDRDPSVHSLRDSVFRHPLGPFVMKQVPSDQSP